MKTIEFKKHRIEIFSSIEDLPIKRYQKFNKFLMIDNEVGSTFEDYDIRTQKAIELLSKNLKDEAIIELENRRLAVFNSYNEYSPVGFAFAILVKKIDDQEFSDYSDDGLNRIIETLDKIGFSFKELTENVQEIKKKIDDAKKLYFPNAESKSSEIEMNGLVLARMRAQINLIENFCEENEKALFEIEKEILLKNAPRSWNVYVKGNMEIEMEVEFEKYLIAVSEHTNESIESMSVFRFETMVNYLKEKNSKNG
jgi:hypothetical protein